MINSVTLMVAGDFEELNPRARPGAGDGRVVEVAGDAERARVGDPD